LFLCVRISSCSCLSLQMGKIGINYGLPCYGNCQLLKKGYTPWS
jgi:hypothetical protein